MNAFSGRASYVKSAAGAQTALLAAAPFDRNVIVIATVDEVFANGTGAQPTFTVGDEVSAARLVAAARFTSAALGAQIVGHGQLPRGLSCFVTATAGTGTATGGITVTVLAADAGGHP